MSDVSVRILDGMAYSSIEMTYNTRLPIWEVLDEVSNYFEENELDPVTICSMTTAVDPEDEDSLILTVIWA